MQKKTYHFILVSIFLVTAFYHASAQTILIPTNATWKYLDDGSNQDTLWRQVDFDDSQWAEGAAQFGFGDGDEATTLTYGPERRNKYVTYYFRHSFEIDDIPDFKSLTMKILRDDGAVVYLNGIEIARSNMPDGPIDYQTFAASIVLGNAEDTYYEHFADGRFVLPGKNVVAVEVHLESKITLDMSFDMELIASKALPVITRKGPYLIFPGDNTKMKVLWQLKKSAECTLAWGLDTEYSLGNVQTTEYGDDHQHTYTITGLEPNAKYYYRVIAEGDTNYASFYAAPDSEATTIKFCAYGDTRSDPASHNKVAQAVVSTFIEDEGFHSLLLFSGDFVDYGNDEIEWDEQFFDPQYEYIKTLLAHLPLHAAKGNHESSVEIYQKYFPYPYVKGCYWSFDYGPVHFAIVDQYTGYGAGSDQLTWLENDLAGSKKSWKVICLHEPGWSAGIHENNDHVQERIQPLCEQYGVQMVIAGHNHNYARAVVNNVQHITAGGGGAPLYAPNNGYPFVVAKGKVHHFCKIEIDEQVLKYAAVTPTGQVIDEFTIDQNAIAIETMTNNLQPGDITLYSAYPNPFNPTTTIAFSLPTASYITLKIYNINGQLVTTLVDGNLASGNHQITWDAKNDYGQAVVSGIYFYEISMANFNQAKKMILMR